MTKIELLKNQIINQLNYQFIIFVIINKFSSFFYKHI